MDFEFVLGLCLCGIVGFWVVFVWLDQHKTEDFKQETIDRLMKAKNNRRKGDRNA